MKVETTPRGFEIINFTDRLNQQCSVQQSSAIIDDDRPGASALWIGVGTNRMHVTRAQVIELSEHIHTWIRTGKL